MPKSRGLDAPEILFNFIKFSRIITKLAYAALGRPKTYAAAIGSGSGMR